jgi:hypothetical protein
MNKRLFFSLEGIDLNDDDALEALAHRIWEQATAEFAQSADTNGAPQTSKGRNPQ